MSSSTIFASCALLVLMGCGQPLSSLGVDSSSTTGLTLIQTGEKLFQQKSCINCHAKTNESGIGPGLGGLFGSKVILDDGKEVTADEAYLRESILDPKAKIRAGKFDDRMPALKFSEQDLTALVEYIKTLK